MWLAPASVTRLLLLSWEQERAFLVSWFTLQIPGPSDSRVQRIFSAFLESFSCTGARGGSWSKPPPQRFLGAHEAPGTVPGIAPSLPSHSIPAPRGDMGVELREAGACLMAHS